MSSWIVMTLVVCLYGSLMALSFQIAIFAVALGSILGWPFASVLGYAEAYIDCMHVCVWLIIGLLVYRSIAYIFSVL